MFGMRCEECGEVRWSIFGREEDKSAECPACGGEMTAERRYPGRAGSRFTAEERRERVAPPAISG